ncbi:hypothetical protein E4O04_10670 [Treponema sp. OMZ 799]|uniref:hypothetical protein n=1 Tax=Treponema sp. OMZ 799 TaxID=2563668 RepID=UPI0020A2B29C|nr:hypothetical protein [Treponema sp. OMZ 799]UTC78434.1 hypothetical protein E4O04_10670 [Treponema sp. OMZ 799]
MHNLLKVRVFPVLLASVLLFAACANKEAEPETVSLTEKTEAETKSLNIRWYYFTQAEKSETPCLKQTDSPEKVPKQDFMPWTEALRVSGLGLMYDPPLFLVNKAGILPAFPIEEEPKIEIKSEFYTKTAEGFYKTGIGSLLRLYTNTIFSSVLPDESPSSLLRYNSVNGELLSLIRPEHFKLTTGSQLSALEFDKKWFAAFKTEQGDHVTFDYFSFSSFEDLLKGTYSVISQEEFINASSPSSLVGDKDGIGKILKMTGKNIKAEIFSEDLNTKQVIFYQNTNNSYAGDFEITASVCQFTPENNQNPFKAVLLETGRLFYTDTETQEWKEISLPALPQDFIYTYFVIKNDIIISAWEEQSFFETGRTGLLVYKIRQ